MAPLCVQLWPQVFGHVVTALVMFQLFMVGILAVKQSYTSSLVVPLLFITAIFTMVCRGIFEKPFQVMSLRGAVDLDKHEEACMIFSHPPHDVILQGPCQTYGVRGIKEAFQ